MRYPTLAAAVLMGATAMLHVIAGGAEFHAPIQDSALDLPLRAISAVLWHAVTMLLLTQTVALLWLARQPDTAMAALLTAIQIGFAGLFLFYGQTMQGTVWLMGQWTIFLAMAVLIIWGAWGAVKGPAPRLP